MDATYYHILLKGNDEIQNKSWEILEIPFKYIH